MCLSSVKQCREIQGKQENPLPYYRGPPNQVDVICVSIIASAKEDMFLVEFIKTDFGVTFRKYLEWYKEQVIPF